MIKSILITGSNRGLGLGLVKQLLSIPNPPDKIIATCRNLENAKELREIANKHKNVHILLLDVTDFNSYDDFKRKLENILQDDGLNVLFNNAGTYPRVTKLELLNSSHLVNAFVTNTVAPIMLTKTLVPLLKTAAQKNSDKPIGSERAAIINMSSILASISENSSEGLYPYKCSKAALNMATKTLSIELKEDNIMAICLHPGWVKTDMGGPNARLDIEPSVKGIVDLILSVNSEHNGGFYQYDGKQLPW
ncbi:uncharacterized protein LOC108739852 [Agrilus planipennis]|uniref:Uncharacterized protein LOC108739852 n=1 Tax=Agrilus planipennis TaxID=224129 RepID=A0A7F5RCZ0_AGRPL|nr:uncharacterized protein LOC108739852 [Agrilus planipennis]